MAAKKMSASTREEVTEAAVMQTVTENRAIRAYFKEHPTGKPGGSGVSLREIRESKEYQAEVARLKAAAKAGDSKAKEQYADVREDTQILDSYFEQHGDADPKVLDFQHDSEKQWGASALIGTDDSYTVAFSGTDQGEGIDDGEGLYVQSTFNQRMAAEYYDKCYEAYGDFDGKSVTVVGHSKGGNKAMYTTMSASHADSIDSCVALDGQGFSQEFLDSWKGNEDTFEERRKKIKLIAGQHDYVHALGIPIALEENTYYVDYNGSSTSIMNLHKHQYLFAHEGGIWTAELESDKSPAAMPRMVREFMDVYMTYPTDIKEKTAPGLMELLWGGASADGMDPNTFSTLLYTFMASVALLVKGVMGNKAASKLFYILGRAGETYRQVSYDKASEVAAKNPEFYLDPVALAEGSSYSGGASVCYSLADIIRDLDGSISRTAIPPKPLFTYNSTPSRAVDPAEFAEITRLDKEIGEAEKRLNYLHAQAYEMVYRLGQVQNTLRGAIDYMANTAVMFEVCESKASSLVEGWRSNPFGKG